VELLIYYDVDINKANNNGFTPFYIACSNGRLEIVELLMYYDVGMTTISLSNYIAKFNISLLMNCLFLVQMMKL
jgi:ankyrin repeat protein